MAGNKRFRGDNGSEISGDAEGTFVSNKVNREGEGTHRDIGSKIVKMTRGIGGSMDVMKQMNLQYIRMLGLFRISQDGRQ